MRHATLYLPRQSRHRLSFLACGLLLGSFWLVGLCVLLAFPLTANASAELVFGDPETPTSLTSLRISGQGAETVPLPERTPLGSLWKLFVYAYLSGSGQSSADYVCTGKNPREEVYCCDPGQQIGRDAALAKSCGLYFMPQRIGLTKSDWKTYWQKEAPHAPDWLFELDNLRPEKGVSVRSLLAALAAVEGDTRRTTMAALQGVTLEPRARALLAFTGNTLRVKTWSWFETPEKPANKTQNSPSPAKSTQKRIGGFAGWMSDGTPIWLRGRGTSASVIDEAAPWLAAQLPELQGDIPETACVKVRFFTRYPLAEVRVDGKIAEEGGLHGKIEARFINGQTLIFNSTGDITLEQIKPQPRLTGRFGLNDYIARVIEREASSEPREAARALAVAARTYLVRHAGYAGGCYEIDDDSRAQRVSAKPPGQAARRVAQWSDGLILSGVAGRYHSHKVAKDQLAWQNAVKNAEAGVRWETILEDAYGKAAFAIVGEHDLGECVSLPAAERWLSSRQTPWSRQLIGLPGYEKPRDLPKVCRLNYGNPYADIDRGRIYATGVATANERLTLTHEYLHFALAYHPRGQDEEFVEQTARKLLELP